MAFTLWVFDGVIWEGGGDSILYTLVQYVYIVSYVDGYVSHETSFTQYFTPLTMLYAI